MSRDVARAFGAWQDFAALGVTSDWFLKHSNLFRLRSACLRQPADHRQTLLDGRWKLFARWRDRCQEVAHRVSFLLAVSCPSPLDWPILTGDEAFASGAFTAPLRKPVPAASPGTGPRTSVRRGRARTPMVFEASERLSCLGRQQAPVRRGLRRFRDHVIRARAEEGLMERAASHAGRRWLARWRTSTRFVGQSRITHDVRVIKACQSEGLLRRQGAALVRWRSRLSLRRRLFFLRVFFAVGRLVMAMRCWRQTARHYMRINWAWRICLQKRLHEWKRRSARLRSVSWAPLPVNHCPVGARPGARAPADSQLCS
jgi:hypothetical protein